MADSTGAAAWAVVVVAGAASLGIHPSGVACAALGAGVGLLVGHGMGRWSAIGLAALMTLGAPLLASWAVSLRPAWFGPPQVAIAAMAFVIAVFAPVALRVMMQHMPVIVEAAMDRLAGVIRGRKR